MLSKTGVVERSGQGMDKIFLYTLSEGKPAPDCSYSDDFTVTGILLATVKDKAFAMYVQGIQQVLPDDKKLTVFDVMALCEVRDGAKHSIDKQTPHTRVKKNAKDRGRAKTDGLLDRRLFFRKQ